MSRIQELEVLIKHHKVLYYQGRPEISDEEFDNLEEELSNLDPGNKVLEMVGSIVVKGKKVKHDKKMLSLSKTYKLEELNSWLGKNDAISMYKIDGVSCSLIYQDGNLIQAKTRGNGSIGEDITPKVLWIKSIPQKLSLSYGDDKKIEIRGELYCKFKDFLLLADEMEKIGLERPTSPRNIVAGLMSRKDNLELCRYISFSAFEIIGPLEDIETEYNKCKLLERMGVDVLDYTHHVDNTNFEKVIQDALDFMTDGDFQIDGLVFILNDLKLQKKMGETAHHPRYKMAFKFQGMSKQSKIKEILWSVSRNGILTPVAKIAPIELSGAKISRVTLHNYGVVKQYNLKKGDLIEIIRSGEVIPKFLQVVESIGGEITVPSTCPSCSSKVVIDDIRLLCSNKNCIGRNKECILNFIQKIGIDEISLKRLEEMMSKGLVAQIEDLYRLKVDDFYKLDKVKEKLANKLYQSIRKSTEVDLITLLASLGIRGGAFNKCEKVVKAGFDTVSKIKKMTKEDLMNIESFAEKSSLDFISSLKEKIPLLDNLIKLGFNIKSPTIKSSPSLIENKIICITGALSEKRSVIEEKIRKNGGMVVNSVSKNTDYLLTNELKATSSKYKKAQELGIEIINEKRFFSLIEKS